MKIGYKIEEFYDLEIEWRLKTILWALKNPNTSLKILYRLYFAEKLSPKVREDLKKELMGDMN